MRESVVSLLRTRAEQQPSRVGYAFVPEAGAVTELTYAELDRQARSIASLLSELGLARTPVVLAYGPGPEYLAAFFGCLYAGAIAVPACPPDPQRLAASLGRLTAIIEDAAPSAVLTTSAIATVLRAQPRLSLPPLVTTDEMPDDPAPAWQPGRPGDGAAALIQYTSGSTSAPRGVVLTQQNLIDNSALIRRFFSHSGESRAVSWLPFHHDMGLIGGIIQPLYAGFPVTLLTPATFLREPIRWLQEISRTRATTSGGPNFAYDLCVRKTTEAQRRQLDLSSWRVAFNGSEPIHASTIENFSAAFEPAGFKREAFHPCYGLAEATLMVTGGVPWSRQSARPFDAASLRSGVAISGLPDARSRRLVSCGLPAGERGVVIVDPDTCAERAPGQVGEIWISGRTVGSSYWRRPDETRETFAARLAGTGEGPFMRSGDLGFVLGRQLFVTGRLKDLIIIRGRNHYPQDIELTAGQSHPALRPGRAAAFTAGDGDGEQLVLAHEVYAQAGQLAVAEVARAIRAAVAAEHEVKVRTVVLVPPGEIPRTSSGKVRRKLCAAMFEAGKLVELGRSEISRPTGTRPPCVDLTGLLAAPGAERQRSLQDYLSGLVAAACGIDAGQVADAPLLALGVDSCAMLAIQHSIEADLGVHLTISDLACAVTVAALAARLADSFGRPTRDPEGVRLYCWVSGTRVPAHAAPRLAERPRWAS